LNPSRGFMIWQDLVIAVVNILFSYALIPQVYHGFKKRKSTVVLQTSIIMTIGLYVMAFAFFTLKLYFSTVLAIITGTMWFLLLIQNLIYR